MTTTFSLMTVRLVRLRTRLLGRLEASLALARTERSRKAFFRVQLVVMVCNFCALIEGTFGWVSGSSWLQALRETFYTLDAIPSMHVIAINVGISFAASAVAWLWIYYMADNPFDVSRRSQRWHVERYFITNALTFFVGWCYVTWMRGLVYQTRLAMQLNDNLDGISEDEVRAFFGALATLMLFGPIATAILIRTKLFLGRRYHRLTRRIVAIEQPPNPTANGLPGTGDDDTDGSEAKLQARMEAASMREMTRCQLEFAPIICSARIGFERGVRNGGGLPLRAAQSAREPRSMVERGRQLDSGRRSRRTPARGEVMMSHCDQRPSSGPSSSNRSSHC